MAKKQVKGYSKAMADTKIAKTAPKGGLPPRFVAKKKSKVGK